MPARALYCAGATPNQWPGAKRRAKARAGLGSLGDGSDERRDGYDPLRRVAIVVLAEHALLKLLHGDPLFFSESIRATEGNQ